MRSLSGTLAAAQKQPSAQPHVSAVFSDYHGDVSRLRFQRLHSGSEGDYFSAVTVAGDGSLVRARIDPSTKVLYTQRVTTPGPGSDFSAWTSHGAVSAGGAVALASAASSVWLFYVDADTVTLKVKESADNGASYGSATTVATAGAAAVYLSAAVSLGGDRVLFWTVGATVWSSRFNGGSWAAAAAWTNNVASITGIACHYRSDFNLVVCGTATTSLDAAVWTVIYGDDGFQLLNTWSSLRELTTATANSNVTFRSPALAFLQHWRLFFVEKLSATQAYARLQSSTMPAAASYDLDRWREPAPFDYESDYGVAAAAGNGVVWLATPAGVWSSPSPTTPDLDVTLDVVEAVVSLDEDGGDVRLVLRNAPAGPGEMPPYSAYGAGSLAALQRGARLQLAAGYRTPAGNETSTGPAYWVDSIELVSGPSPVVVVRARDAWALLEQWRARRQFFWAAGARSVSELIEFVCVRAGLDYGAISTSTSLTTFKPAFTIQPGQDGKSAVRRLLATVPDELLVRGSGVLALHPQASDSPVYAFEATGGGEGAHRIVRGAYRDMGPALNRVRVFGAGVSNEGLDFDDIARLGERTATVHDLNLTTSALASTRAAAGLRGVAVRAGRDELTVFGVNCGQELYDVVSVTDAAAGLSQAARRVLGLFWRFSTGAQAGESRYDMTLLLGRP